MIKSTGIILQLDDLGRLIIPDELRKAYNIKTGDSLEISTDNGALILKKHEEECTFCSSPKNLSFQKGKPICGRCIEEFTESKKSK